MSASQHMVRVVRRSTLDSEPPTAPPTRTRTILLACLTVAVFCLVGIHTAPQIPGIVSALQARLTLSQYWPH